MTWLKLNEARKGQIVKLDNGFTCHRAGRVILQKDGNGIFFSCKEGKHYIDGQADDGIHCVGIES